MTFSPPDKNPPASQKRPLRARVSKDEYQMLMRLRDRKPAQHPPQAKTGLGNLIADAVAATMGSWTFIIIQSSILGLWVLINSSMGTRHWDPYPFILLNLMLSFQAAYSAPIIMMSQNRQAEIDRRDAKHGYEVNMKAELEIELLHDKMNLLREEEIARLLRLVQDQKTQLARLERLLSPPVLSSTSTQDKSDE
jgi:uncharacterized membrane protein